MNGLESTNLLFKWFSENSCFLLERDFKEIVPISENEDEDRAVIIFGLNDLQEKNLISKSEYNGKEYWVLNKPFEAYPQDVTINAPVALGVQAIINSFCDVLENQEDKCDASNVTEKDIQNIIYICNTLVQSKGEEDNSVD